MMCARRLLFALLSVAALAIAFFAGEFVGGGAGVGGVEFAEGQVVEILRDGLVRF